ncbi:MAG TPA: Hsp70 family protein, partial [Acidimicrobiales bacterium]
MRDTGYRLGVDLGTTWTAAALADPATGSVEPLALGSDAPAMPSVLAVDPAGSGIVAGERAERLLLTDPTTGVREWKRRLGDTTPLVLGGQPHGAEALAGHLLRHVVEAATAATGERPAEVVLTHPATWGGYKLDLLREAARLAGVTGSGAGAGEGTALTLLPEPVAAARHYVALGRLTAGDQVAVYDFGGGTFDAAVVRCTVDGAEVLGRPEGLERVGGVDLDQIVLVHVDQALDGRPSELAGRPEGRRALARLRAECTAAKEALSHDTDVTIPVALPGLHTEVRLTRDELEAAARARIADTVAALERAIGTAGVAPAALAGVLLAGGASRMPLVAEEVGRRIGRPILLDADPKLVVALGAAGGDIDMTTPRNPDPADADRTHGGSPPPPPPPPPRPTAPADPAARAAALRAAAAGNAPAPRRSRGATIAGAAAAGAAAAAGGYLAYETFIDDEDGSDGPTDAELAEELVASLTESLDAFEDLATGGAGGGGGNGGGGGGRGTVFVRDGGGGGGAPGRAPAAPSPAPTEAELADIEEARAELLERFRAWQPPEGADPEDVAAFRAEVERLINEFTPRPGQSANDALAELRRQFDDEVQDFVQDLKLDALAERDAHDHAGPHWEWDEEQGRWEWEGDQYPTRDGFEWIPRHLDADGNVVEGHWERPPAGGVREDRPGLDWVEPHVDASGRTVPGHWQPVSTPESRPVPTSPSSPSTGDRVWVEGRYDDHGNYVKGHWEGGAADDDGPPPLFETPTLPPPPPPPIDQPQPTTGTPAPDVRDHRDDDVYSPRRPSSRDRDGDDDRPGGVVVRDHRGEDDRERPPVRDGRTEVRDHRGPDDVHDGPRAPGIPGLPN